MPYRFLPQEPLSAGVRRIVVEQVDRAVDELRDVRLDREDRVHQARKRCKKIRAVLRLVRPGLVQGLYQEENAWYRDLARSVSRQRDARVMVDTFSRLLKSAELLERQALDGMLMALCERRDREERQDADLEQQLAELASQLWDGRERVSRWPLSEEGFDTIAPGLKRTYRAARRARKKALKKPSPERLHTWRKRVKDHGYHLALLREFDKRRLKTRGRRLKQLGQTLGELHDLDVLGEFIRREQQQFDTRLVGLALELLDRERDGLLAQVEPIGERLFHRRPKKMAGRLRRRWSARSAAQQPRSVRAG